MLLCLSVSDARVLVRSYDDGDDDGDDNDDDNDDCFGVDENDAGGAGAGAGAGAGGGDDDDDDIEVDVDVDVGDDPSCACLVSHVCCLAAVAFHAEPTFMIPKPVKPEHKSPNPHIRCNKYT